MTNQEENGPPPFTREIRVKTRRKLRARRQRENSIWYGLGMFGVVGWSIAIPTLLGILIGRWLDSVWPAPMSWTLTLLLTGLVIGILNAWRWVERERQDMERAREEAERDDE